jgi:hypothetical protein
MGDSGRVSDTVRIVVAEGSSSRKGFLRFVLEGEGYEVAGEASNPAELARSVALHEPDVVVMDDGIGATSVAMVHDLAPTAKVVLVWPGAVMPIGGDARVEPANVLRELGLTVEDLTGVACATSLAGGVAGARDAASLRDVLARGEAAQLHRPGATEDAEPADGDAIAVTVAAVGAVGAAAAVGTGAADTADAAAAASTEVAAASAGADASATALNRRLGTIALSGAAAAGALVLALALGGSRVPVSSISGAAAEPSSPGIGQPSIAPFDPGGEGAAEGPGDGRAGGGSAGGALSRGGNEPLCNYYIETCLPPAGPTGTGGLSMGDIYVSGGGDAAAPPVERARGRESRRHDGRRHGHDGHRSARRHHRDRAA